MIVLRNHTLDNSLLLLLPLLCLTITHTVVAQEGLSLRGIHPNDHMSIQMSSSSLDATIDLKCFETSDELRDAVNAYEGYNIIDTTLATTYGWPMNNWCVSQIQDFSNLFLRKTKFNEPLDGWDMSSATSLSGIFMSALAFDQDLSQWDVRRVHDFSRAFFAATSFNSDITHWNTTRATDMSYMFLHAHAFSHNLFDAWDVSQVQHMEKMFQDSRGMIHYGDEASAWPLLQTQQGLPTIDLTNKEKAAACASTSLRASQK